MPTSTLGTCRSCHNNVSGRFCFIKDCNSLEKIHQCKGFEKGDIIFRPGELPKGLYIIRSGLVKIEVVSIDGSAHILRLKGIGNCLGYRSLFANEPYSASASALEDSVLCYISKERLSEFMAQNPPLAISLISQLANELRVAESKWVRQIDNSAQERIAEALILLDEHYKGRKWTRREIGEWAGVTPETVMRVLSKFKEEGLIRSTGRLIHLADPEKLKKMIRDVDETALHF